MNDWQKKHTHRECTEGKMAMKTETVLEGLFEEKLGNSGTRSKREKGFETVLTAKVMQVK